MYLPERVLYSGCSLSSSFQTCWRCPLKSIAALTMVLLWVSWFWYFGSGKAQGVFADTAEEWRWTCTLGCAAGCWGDPGHPTRAGASPRLWDLQANESNPKGVVGLVLPMCTSCKLWSGKRQCTFVDLDVIISVGTGGKKNLQNVASP